MNLDRFGAAVLASFLVWQAWAPFGRAQDQADEARMIAALSDPSFKIRLQAAIQIGKWRVSRAAPLLKRALLDEQDAVRAAAALSLGRLGDESARVDLAALLSCSNRLVSEAAEKSLIYLDQARGKPRYLLVLETPTVAAGMSVSMGERLRAMLQQKLSKRSDLVFSAGEEKILSPDNLSGHLQKRSLTGILLKPRIAQRISKAPRSGAVISLDVGVMVVTLERKRMEFDGNQVAKAEVDSADLSDSEREEIDQALLSSAAEAATDQIVQYLARRTGP